MMQYLTGNIGIIDYMIVSSVLFGISIIGIFLNRNNVIVLLMAIELMLLSVSFNFVVFASFMQDISGQIFVFFILTVAAAESAIGLAILILVFKRNKSINIKNLTSLKN